MKILFNTSVKSAINPQQRKRPSMPFHINSKDARKSAILICILTPYPARYPSTRLKTRPLAATDATWPETFALTACISKIFSGSSFSAIF